MDKELFQKAKELEEEIKRLKEDISDLNRRECQFALAMGEGSMYRELQSLSNSVVKEILSQELKKRLQDRKKQFENL